MKNKKGRSTCSQQLDYEGIPGTMLAQKAHPIGIFDSGVGGLTVASAILTLLPEERLIYFGDTVSFPVK